MMSGALMGRVIECHEQGRKLCTCWKDDAPDDMQMGIVCAVLRNVVQCRTAMLPRWGGILLCDMQSCTCAVLVCRDVDLGYYTRLNPTSIHSPRPVGLCVSCYPYLERQWFPPGIVMSKRSTING